MRWGRRRYRRPVDRHGSLLRWLVRRGPACTASLRRLSENCGCHAEESHKVNLDQREVGYGSSDRRDGWFCWTDWNCESNCRWPRELIVSTSEPGHCTDSGNCYTLLLLLVVYYYSYVYCYYCILWSWLKLWVQLLTSWAHSVHRLTWPLYRLS